MKTPEMESITWVACSAWAEPWLYPATGMVVVIKDASTDKAKSVLARLDDVPLEWRTKVYGLPHAFLHGYLNGNGLLLLPEILNQSRLSARKEKIDGIEFHALEAVGQ